VIPVSSADDVASHLKFAEERDLRFNLLSDPDHSMIENMAPGERKSMYGKKYGGDAHHLPDR
jgi:peroxiredoxin